MNVDERLKDLIPHVSQAMIILNLKTEDIINVTAVEKIVITKMINGSEVAQIHPDFSPLPPGWNFNTGYFSPKGVDGNHRPLPPSIFLSLYDYKTGSLFTQDQLLTAWLHETRHAYQYRYDRKLYNSEDPEDPKNPVKNPAEIDADAFAIAYMEACTTYNPDSYLWLIRRYMARDNGARRKLADHMLKIYF